MSLRDSYHETRLEARGVAAWMNLLERWTAWRDPSLKRIRYVVAWSAWDEWWRVEAVPR